MSASDYYSIAVTVFTLLGSLVAYLSGIPRLVRWLNKPSLSIQSVGIFYTRVSSSPTTYNYADQQGGIAAVIANISVDFMIGNPRLHRRLKKRNRATSAQWAVEISDAVTGIQVYRFYERTYLNVLGPDSKIPLSHQLTVSLSSPQYRVYIFADCKEGSTATFDDIVNVAEKPAPTVLTLPQSSVITKKMNRFSSLWARLNARQKNLMLSGSDTLLFLASAFLAQYFESGKSLLIDQIVLASIAAAIILLVTVSRFGRFRGSNNPRLKYTIRSVNWTFAVFAGAFFDSLLVLFPLVYQFPTAVTTITAIIAVFVVFSVYLLREAEDSVNPTVPHGT